LRALFYSNIPTPYQLDFARAMARELDFRPLFLWDREPNRDWQLEAAGFSVLDATGGPGDRLRLLAELEHAQPDLLLVGGYSLPYCGTVLAWAQARRRPVVFWLERPFEASGPRGWLKEAYLRAVLPRAAAICGIGELACRRYRRYHPRVVNLPYACELGPYLALPPRPVAPGPLRVLFSGQLIERKNVAALVEAALSLPPDSVRLTLLGSGELRAALEARVAGDPRVTLRGFVQPAALPPLFAEHDLFALPSLHDGWGLVVNEAMAAALPVLATPQVGAARDLVQHGETGWLAGRDAGSLARALRWYASHPEQAPLQGALARARFLDSAAHLPNAVQRMVQLFAEVLR